MAELSWVSVRHVVLHPADESGSTRHFEERVTTWHASDMEEAIALAEAEVAEYCTDLGLVDAGLYQAYLLADDPGGLVSGVETFSLIRESELPAKDYLDRFFDTGQELQRTVGSTPSSPEWKRIAEDAGQRISADLKRCGRDRELVAATVTIDEDGITASGPGGTAGEGRTTDDREALVAQASDIIQAMMSGDDGYSVWPACDLHDRGLHAVVRDGQAVWWCGMGHSCGAVGSIYS